MSARTAISAFWVPLALIGSVRQITEPTYCLPLGSDGSSSYSTTRCATGAICSDEPGWPTRSGIFGFDCGADASFGASTVGDDLNRPLTKVTADLPHRMPAPARIRTMPIAIALLNGNTVPVRARRAIQARRPRGGRRLLLGGGAGARRRRRRGGGGRHLRRLRRLALGLLD